LSSITNRLGLLKKDPAADSNDTFNIKTMLNDNWDLIDQKVPVFGPDGKVSTDQLTPPSDASTSQKGIVQLSISTSSTSTTQAATPSAVKEVKDSIPVLNNTVASTSTTQAATANAVKAAYDKAVSAETNAKTYSDQQLATHTADYLKHTGYAVATGSANTYVATLNPALSAYAEGVSLRLKINLANTGASTVDVNGLGAKAIKNGKGNDVATGNLKAGVIYTLAYDGTSFILQGEGGSGTATAPDVLAGKTATTDVGDIIGTMVDRGAMTITPGTTDQVIPAGKHNGSGKVVGDADLIASNIKSGATVFGIVGNVEDGSIVRPGDDLLVKVTGIVSQVAMTPVKKREIKILNTGVVRVKFNLRASNSGTSSYGRVYVNGIAVGTNRTVTSTTNTLFTEDINVNTNDLVQLYLTSYSDTYVSICDDFGVYAIMPIKATVTL
jgi:hypothetical protein